MKEERQKKKNPPKQEKVEDFWDKKAGLKILIEAYKKNQAIF